MKKTLCVALLWAVAGVALAAPPKSEDCDPSDFGGKGSKAEYGGDASGTWMHWTCTVGGKTYPRWIGIEAGSPKKLPSPSRANLAAYKSIKAYSDKKDWSQSWLPTQVMIDIAERQQK